MKETAQLENTIIVFMGDNGLLEGEHGMVDKRTGHEPCLRIPIIARGPGLPVEKVVAQQVLTIDVAPSLLALCKAPALPAVQGRSWVQLANSGDDSWRKSWFYEYNYEKQFPYTPNVRAIRTDRWKYIHYPHGDGTPDKHIPELYDLQTDPEERRNLAGKPEHAAQQKALAAQLTALLTAEGLTPDKDKMPLDEGVKSTLPDQKMR